MTANDLERLHIWIIASVRQALDRRIKSSLQPQIAVYYEADLVGDAQLRKPERLEIRIDGPIEMSRHKHQRGYRVECNILVYSTYNETDLFKHQKNTSTAVRALGEDINVYEYGYSDSTKNFVGCLQLVPTRNDLVTVAEHGQIDAIAKVQQATVEAHYIMWLDT